MNYPSLSLGSACRVAAFTLVLTASTWSAAAAPLLAESFPLKITTSLGVDPTLTTPVTAYELPEGSNTAFYESSNQYGPTAVLAPGSPDVVRSIRLSYYSDYTLIGGLTLRVYANDGIAVGPLGGMIPAPSTQLSELVADISGIPGGGLTSFSVSYAFDPVKTLPASPDSFTVTLQFAGLDATHHAGWYLSDQTATTGSSPVYFFENEGGSWIAKVAVPEPNSTLIAGAVLGAFAMLLRLRRGNR
jgi:hypothetical protein